MSRSRSTIRILPLALTALTGLPIAAHITTEGAEAAAKSARVRTFSGPVEYVDHGPVQVTIGVKNKKITGVKVGYSPQEGRSYVIQNQAIPLLRQETLRAQSANISEISGATDTSSGYIASLQSAVKKARQAKALK